LIGNLNVIAPRWSRYDLSMPSQMFCSSIFSYLDLLLSLSDLPGLTKEARKYFELQKNIYSIIYNYGHPTMAATTNNHGQVLKDLGDKYKARKCFEILTHKIVRKSRPLHKIGTITAKAGIVISYLASYHPSSYSRILPAPSSSSYWPSACSLGIHLPGAPQVDILSTSLNGPHPEGIRQDMASSMLVAKEIFR
jgi:hypothetical protein